MARNLNQEAWILYYLTSSEYYEECAKACEAFADVFSRLVNRHGLNGTALLGYWTKRFFDHAKAIRKAIEFVHEQDYTPIFHALSGPASDSRGLTEQPLGWMKIEEAAQYEAALEKAAFFSAVGNQALVNTGRSGEVYEQRESYSAAQLNRDTGFRGEDLGNSFQLLKKHGLAAAPPDRLPDYQVNRESPCKTGEVVPWTGVWFPATGLERYSLAFAVKGNVMQFAYHLLETRQEQLARGLDVLEAWDEVKAEEITWYPLSLAEANNITRLRAEPGERCPKGGWWASPAIREPIFVRQGERMPGPESTSYGSVIWNFIGESNAPNSGLKD